MNQIPPFMKAQPKVALHHAHAPRNAPRPAASNNTVQNRCVIRTIGCAATLPRPSDPSAVCQIRTENNREAFRVATRLASDLAGIERGYGRGVQPYGRPPGNNLRRCGGRNMGPNFVSPPAARTRGPRASSISKQHVVSPSSTSEIRSGAAARQRAPWPLSTHRLKGPSWL